VKARGALDGPVTALPLGAEAFGVEGVGFAAWIWPSVICLTGVAVSIGCPCAVTVTVTVDVGQIDGVGTKIAGIGVIAAIMPGAGMMEGTSLGAGIGTGTSLDGRLTCGIIPGVLEMMTLVGTEEMVVWSVTGMTAGVLASSGVVDITTSVGVDEMVV